MADPKLPLTTRLLESRLTDYVALLFFTAIGFGGVVVSLILIAFFATGLTTLFEHVFF